MAFHCACCSTADRQSFRLYLTPCAVAVSDLLSLGAETEVLGPPALRKAVIEAVRALAARYPPAV
ncbi:WYL domain-containing protein [Streptomyces spirodelae]|uniref:WYL domain-containing protein n=1 Tax=Streptomyces spirodelae TaxID=2812904 RepID=UPI0027DB4202|nr:WYL domain-containing protein [Streptomyces spirodelae]